VNTTTKSLRELNVTFGFLDLQGYGILGLQLGSREPNFVLMLNGDSADTESGQNALFLILTLFLHHCRRTGGTIGGRSLAYMKLDRVVRQQKGIFSLHHLRKLRIWQF